MPLNGAAANTEGGRLQRIIAKQAHCQAPLSIQGNPTSCVSCIPTPSAQPNITPAESSRIAVLTAINNGTLINGGCVTQDRARQLLARVFPQGSTPDPITGVPPVGLFNYGSEGVRIAALQQAVINAAASNAAVYSPPIILPCFTPLPPPPAPPLSACYPLTKNMKLGGGGM
jgi:hypothetical protein